MTLCPSVMCASYASLGEEVRALEEVETDIFHCDIMDGGFMLNISIGLTNIKTARALTKKMADVHLVIDHPVDKVDWLLDAGIDLIYIHPESEPQVMRTLVYIRSRGKLSGLAVNPDTSLSTVKELFPHCDYLLVMSVSPSFAGQTFIGGVDTKIRELITREKMYGYHIILDGVCSLAVIWEYHALSVDGFVLGTSALFHGEGNYMENMSLLRSL